MTPEEKYNGLSHLKVFGCIAYVHVPGELRTKLDPKAKKCVFIGYIHLSRNGTDVITLSHVK